MTRFGTGSVIVLGLIALAAVVSHHSASSTLSPPHPGGDFLVESALDAGPGSLRDAILAADRLTSRARIVIVAPRITLESALPALINPHGVDIDVRAGAGTIDAGREAKGTVLQINSQASVVHGVHVENAREVGMLVNAPGVRIDGVTISGSKTALLVAAAGAGCVVAASIFERNDTGIIADAQVRDLSVLSSVFRSNTRAGFWVVGGEPSAPEADTRERVRMIDAVFEKNETGMVLANTPIVVQKAHFTANGGNGMLILGGAARVEDSEFNDALGTALSINAGTHVVVARSRFVNNASNALQVRDSDVVLENDAFTHNGFGVVLIQTRDHSVVMRDSEVSRTKADAVTLIGGSPLLQRNRITDNFGAGIRVLDIVSAKADKKSAPRFDGNVVKGNGIDMPPSAVYKMADAR